MRVRIPPRAPLKNQLFQEYPLPFQHLLSQLPQGTLLVFLAYGLLAGAYLLVVPLLLFLWMNKRWHLMGKFERTFVYGLVFLFFPGLILFAPFLNLRLQGQGES